MKSLPRITGLTLRQKYCVAVARSSARYRWEDAKAFVRKGLLGDRLGRKFFCEMVIHLSLLLGFPVMLELLEFVSNIGKEKRSHQAASRRSYRITGLRLLRRIYGNQTEKLLENLGRLQPELPHWIVEDVYGKVFSRAGLTLAEREILNSTVLAVQGLERQLYSHVRGMLRVGLQPVVVESILRSVSRSSRKKEHRYVSLVKALATQRR
ncbi:MAG TPA: hypothetical protein VNN76_01405 [Bacteroidota bacterium]|nr:hypothetical protein [Bacteroidota bacterium]